MNVTEISFFPVGLCDGADICTGAAEDPKSNSVFEIIHSVSLVLS